MEGYGPGVRPLAAEHALEGCLDGARRLLISYQLVDECSPPICGQPRTLDHLHEVVDSALGAGLRVDREHPPLHSRERLGSHRLEADLDLASNAADLLLECLIPDLALRIHTRAASRSVAALLESTGPPGGTFLLRHYLARRKPRPAHREEGFAIESAFAQAAIDG